MSQGITQTSREWKETTRQSRNLTIWQEELEDFVPARVLDFHVHVWNRATLSAGGSFSCAGHAVSEYGFEELAGDLADIYPGRNVCGVCMGMPIPGYDRAENNRYVADGCDGERFTALRLLHPADDPAELRREIEAGGFVGLKPYPDFVDKADVNQVEIREMLPDPLMAVADELGLIIVLHIPRRQRLADPLNQSQLRTLCQSWPGARIVLAHIGRAYFLKNIVGHLDRLCDLPNLYIDLTMLNHWEVVEHAFRVFPKERILYGTDLPISVAPGKSVEINDQYTYVTPVPWSLSISDEHHKLVFTSFLYEQLRAMRKAVERLGLDRSFVKDVFWNNGMRLLGREA